MPEYKQTANERSEPFDRRNSSFVLVVNDVPAGAELFVHGDKEKYPHRKPKPPDDYDDDGNVLLEKMFTNPDQKKKVSTDLLKLLEVSVRIPTARA